MYDEDTVKEQLRSVPRVASVDEAFREILKLATDERQHVLLEDCVEWLELKMKAIAKLARRGKKLAKQATSCQER